MNSFFFYEKGWGAGVAGFQMTIFDLIGMMEEMINPIPIINHKMLIIFQVIWGS